MLTETFVASIGAPTKAPGTNVAKDAAIFLHEFQPLATQRTVFKKSATPPNCLAFSENHIFAAQASKAVVHVYSRERGNQEAIVPFPERISSIVLACNDSVLILGTTEGRILAWEIYSGRQVSTAQAHLQAVTALVVDGSSNFLLSSSKDSTIHVWSISDLLSFLTSSDSKPIKTFSAHRSEVAAVIVGHSTSHCNFAVSVSKDKTCLIWDYHSGAVLRTYLLPHVPTCISLDPADRAVYVGYEDGSVQQLLLVSSRTGSVEAVHSSQHAVNPIQPPSSSRWALPDLSEGAALSLDVSYDGTVLLSGHESGSIIAWDVSRGCYMAMQIQAPLPGPVNNLSFLPVSGFLEDKESPHKRPRVTATEVVKPKFGAFDSSETGDIPEDYTVTVQLRSNTFPSGPSAFQTALEAPYFPASFLEQELSSLVAWEQSVASRSGSQTLETASDFMALNSEPQEESLQEENANLKLQLEALQRVQMKSLQSIQKLNEEKKALLRREQQRFIRKQAKQNGVSSEEIDIEMSDADSG